MLRRTRACLRRALADTRGVAAVEMALATPLLLTFFCGVAEMSKFLSIHYKAAQMASTVADVVARYNSVTDEDIESIFAVSATVMGTADFTTHGYVVLSSVARDADDNRASVAWQCSGGGDLVNESRIGETGENAVLPGGLTIERDDNVIVAEIFYDYTQILGFVRVPDTIIYKTAVFRPRLGALTTAPGC